MRSLTNSELKELEKTNNGDINKLIVSKKFDISKSQIFSNYFHGQNKIIRSCDLINSTIKNSTVAQAKIIDSKIINSTIGPGAFIQDSQVSGTVVSPLLIKDSEPKHESDRTSRAFTVIIRNSQINNDVILGGSDFNKTKSRGGSLFAFSHIGDGEFSKNIILGMPPESNNSKTLVNIPHFGYYGKLIALSLAVYRKDDQKDNGKNAKKGNIIPDIDSKSFFEDYKEAINHLYFNTKSKVPYKIGRTNLGAGASVSDYDPVTDKKSGVIVLMANSGVNVYFPPYLTVLYDSLIASGSVDISKYCDGVIPPNSLLIGARSEGALLKDYYDEEKKGILNDRCKQEIDFVMRYMRFLEVFSSVALQGMKSGNQFEKVAWSKAIILLDEYLKSVNKRWLESYFTILEEKSIPALKKRLEKDDREKLRKQLNIQIELQSNKQKILNEARQILKSSEKIVSSMSSIELSDSVAKSRSYEIVYTPEQKQSFGSLLLKVHEKIEL